MAAFSKTDQDSRHSSVHKFGYNASIATADTPEDVWDGSLSYPWPSAAAVTTIVSDSADDDEGGTGAITVRVYGLDANYAEIDEVATLNGIGVVTLDNEYLRVFRAKVLTAGSGDVNAGNILVKQSTTVVTQITAGYGQTLMAIYTVPAGKTAYLSHWYATLGKAQTTIAEITLDMREFDSAWQTKELISLSNSSGDFSLHYPEYRTVSAKTDIRVRVRSVSANDTNVSSGFDLLLPWT